MTTPTPHGAPELTNIDLAKAHGADICDEWDIVDKTEREQISFTTAQLDAYTSAAIEQAQSKHEGKSMNNEQAKTAALSWLGEAGGELLPRLTANELAGIVNEAIQQAAGAVPEGMVSVGHQYLFPDPLGGEMWLNSPDEWNGHKPQGSREIFAASPSPLGREAAPNLAELLQSCRGSVKSDLSRNEQLLLVKRVPNLHAVIEAEANRLQALLDSIDALAGREAGSSDHLVPCAVGGVIQPLTVGMHVTCLTAPERIWLQSDPECASDEPPKFPVDDEATWCRDRINKSDTLYIRADLVESPTSQINPGSAPREDSHG